jgi:hypothetical protein
MIGGTLGQGDSYENLPSLAGIYTCDDLSVPGFADLQFTLSDVRSVFRRRGSDAAHCIPEIKQLVGELLKMSVEIRSSTNSTKTKSTE